MTTSIPRARELKGFEEELEQLRAETLATVGEKDAKYIRRIIRLQRWFEVGSRTLLMFGFFPPTWILGTALLSLSKILDNMEIGHNVMHGQYDWMNDEKIHSSNFEWDTACDGQTWRLSHNYKHHTYTNIIGKDRDYGYGILRMDQDETWRPQDIFNLMKFWWLSVMFQWGVALQELEPDRIVSGEASWAEKKPILKAFLKKGGRQFFKDYIFFPLVGLLTGAWLSVLIGNLVANFIRNIWASSVIFCGHFPDGHHTFLEAECENESKGQWFYRQILGSCNFSGGKLTHIMSGHLSCQIEHHLFPTIPSSKYMGLSKRVREICEKYNVPYNSRSFFRQYASTVKRMFKLSFPNKIWNKREPALA